MGFRFHRSINLLPGIRINLGKRGLSTSIGVRGAHVTFGETGTRTTVGLPGSALSYTHPTNHIMSTRRLQPPTTPRRPARRLATRDAGCCGSSS
jgi:hypothetical protein